MVHVYILTNLFGFLIFLLSYSDDDGDSD